LAQGGLCSSSAVAAMAGALSRGGSKGRAPQVQALTKLEVQRICQADAALAPYHDEKLSIYSRQHREVGAAFERARECRTLLQNQYDQQARMIRDKFNETRAKTDAAARREQQRMRDLSDEFAAGVDRGAGEWREQLSKDQHEVECRRRAIADTLDGLLASLAEEHESCRADTASETASLNEKLRRSREVLDQEVSGREESHAAFQRTLAEEFSRLRKRLSEEAEVRKKHCSDSGAEAKMRYGELSERQLRLDAAAREWLQDLKDKLGEERRKRASSHEAIVEQMMRFMAEYQGYVAHSQTSHHATREQLLTRKAELRTKEAV